MKVTALVENETKSELKAKHGLSLYIETPKHKILFDVGSDNTLFENAKARGIDEELTLFTVKDTKKCYSDANDALYTKSTKDNFSHEQNLIIQERQTALIMGCGHTGIVNIMEKAE